MTFDLESKNSRPLDRLLLLGVRSVAWVESWVTSGDWVFQGVSGIWGWGVGFWRVGFRHLGLEIGFQRVGFRHLNGDGVLESGLLASGWVGW